jgi:uncharacterized membrane protein YdjX (TVP38/TMEM64 family)
LNKIKLVIKELGLLGPVLAFAIIAPGLGMILLSSSSPLWFPQLSELGLNSLPIFLASAILLAGLSLIPTHAVSLISGMLYGSFLGTSYAIAAILLAAILSFFTISKIVGDKAINSLSHRPQAYEIYTELLKHKSHRSIMIMALIRLSPIMPFAGTNVLLSAAKVKFSEFLVGSLIGLTPRISLVAIAGAGLTELNFNYGSNKVLLIIGVVATILAIVILGKISQKVLRKILKS